MEHSASSSIEEGEACCYEEEDGSFDPDVSLSYIDEKIQNVLGHFQKDFEGGVSAENLGAKFGGYGSFLPTYERSPLQPPPKAPQRNQQIHRSPVNVQGEGSTKMFTASKTPSLGRLGVASCSARPLHTTKLLSADGAVNQGSTLLSAQIAEKSPLINETVKVNPNMQRTTKIRIKLGSDIKEQKNAAIYSGLGLDDSPSSSLSNSHEISGEVPSECHETSDESPTNILQTMTSFPVFGSLLLSPLHDKMLCLTSKERLTKSGSVVRSNQESAVKLADQSGSPTRVFNGLKEKKTGFVDSIEKLKMNGKATGSENGKATGSENLITVLSKEKVKKESSKSKNFMSKKLKLTSPANLKCGISASTMGTAREDDISSEAHKDGLIGNSFSSVLEKEDPMSLQGSCKIERVNASHIADYNSSEKVANDQNGLQIDVQNKSTSISNNTCALFGVDVSKDRETLNAGARNLSKQKLGRKDTFPENKGITVSYRLGNELFDGKSELKEFQSNVKQAANAAEKSLSVSRSAALIDRNDIENGVHQSKRKTHKLKKLKDKTKNLERPLGNRTKGSLLDCIDKEHEAFYDNTKEHSVSGKVEKKSVFEVSLKEAPKGALTDNGLASELVPPIAAPVVIEEDWVGCDSCQKWRLLPYGTKPEQLPEKWMCSMLNWLPGMNRCEISEEETTKALHALYQCPAPEIPINPLKPVDETALDITSLNGYLDQNQSVATRENKKYNRKENTNADSSSGMGQILNCKKNNHHESVKSRSVNGTNQIAVESGFLRNSPEVVIGKNESKLRKQHMNRDDIRQANRIEKRKSDQFEYGELRKVKKENFDSDTYCHSEIEGDLGKVRLGSFAELSTKATGRNMQKVAGVSSSKKSNCSLTERRSFSVKKPKDESQFLLDGGPSDLGLCDRRDDSLKKRKINDGRDNQDPIEGSPLLDRKASKLENDSCEFRKEKKTRISEVEGNESSTNKGNQRANEKGRVPKIILSLNRDHIDNGSEGMKSNDNIQLQRQKDKVAPPNLAEGIDLLNRNCGSGYMAAETTSSSSKVSGFRRSKFKLQEVRGSPVESVSSFPLRNSYPGQVAPESDAENGDVHLRAKHGKFVDSEDNDGRNRSGRTRKENDYRFLPNESTENSTLDYRERVNKKLNSKSKPSVDIQVSHLASGDVDTMGRHKKSSKEHDRTYFNNKSCNDTPEKSDKGLYLQSKDKDGTFSSYSDRNKMKVCNPTSEQEALHLKSLRNDRDIDPNATAKCNAKVNGIKVCIPNKHGKNDKNHVRNKEPVGNWSNDSTQKNVEQDGSYKKLDAQYSKNVKCNPCQDPIPNMVVRKGELFTHREGKKEVLAEDLKQVQLPSEADANVTKASKQLQIADDQKEMHYKLEHPMSNRHTAKDLHASSPGSKDPSDQNFCNALKEAKDHKHFADSLKCSGFGVESSVAYFQAALKFLLAASVLETCNSGKHGDITPIQLYISTAKLCESCACEYEGHQEVAAAALSYKCMEVAYMRAVYCKHLSSSRDRDELQATLQMPPLGESPSSSVSDVDNLNLSKGCGSHVTGQHVIASQNRPSFIRILDFTQYVSLAMEASTKSQKAFGAANILLKQRHNKEGIDFLKRAVDFSFQDVEGFIRLVQLAMEAISHSGRIASKD